MSSSYPSYPEQPQQPPYGSGGGQPGGGDQPGGGYPGSGQAGGYPEGGGYQGGGTGGYQGGGGGYQGGGYGGYGGGGEQKNGFGIAALVLGILAVLGICAVGWGGVLFGIPAIILGILGRKRANNGRANNGGMALAGIITGAIGLIVGLIVGILFAFAGNAAWNLFGDDVRQLTTCMEQASGDRAAEAECQREYRRNIEEKVEQGN